MKHFRTDGEEKQTLIEVGKTLVLSRERIRQIEDRILGKMTGNARKLAGYHS